MNNSLHDHITRLISDIEFEIDECRKTESKASAKADHLITMMVRLGKCLDDAKAETPIEIIEGLGCPNGSIVPTLEKVLSAYTGNSLNSPRTATEEHPPETNVTSQSVNKMDADFKQKYYENRLE